MRIFQLFFFRNTNIFFRPSLDLVDNGEVFLRNAVSRNQTFNRNQKLQEIELITEIKSFKESNWYPKSKVSRNRTGNRNQSFQEI